MKVQDTLEVTEIQAFSPHLYLRQLSHDHKQLQDYFDGLTKLDKQGSGQVRSGKNLSKVGSAYLIDNCGNAYQRIWLQGHHICLVSVFPLPDPSPAYKNVSQKIKWRSALP